MSRKSKKKTRHSNRTTLEDHVRVGKSLQPPFVATIPLTPISWQDIGLPDMLWASLVLVQVPRGEAFGAFRVVLDFVHDCDSSEVRLWDITLTGFSRWPSKVLSLCLNQLISNASQKEIFRPLLLFADLPARSIWQDVIGQQPQEEDWKILSRAVAGTMDRMSLMTLDCMWLRVAAAVIGKRIVLTDRVPKTAKAIFEYSTDHDPSPSDAAHIRVAGMSMLTEDNNKSQPRRWPEAFWKDCFLRTPCLGEDNETERQDDTTSMDVDIVQAAHTALIDHWVASRSTSGIDARHDSAFGIALYSFTVLEELLWTGNAQTVMARLALRTLTECCINLEYLRKHDDSHLWDMFRVYSIGQAKLVSLKLEDLNADPVFTDRNLLVWFANEDKSEEYVSIELGDWANENLRSRAIAVGLKNLYDTYYIWNSQFAHGMWGAARLTVMDNCRNVLHRSHLIPRVQVPLLPNLLPDACKVMDIILSSISDLFPGYAARVSRIVPSPNRAENKADEGESSGD